MRRSVAGSLTKNGSKDPDELTGNGIGSVIVGDGFFMVAVILSFMQSPVSSMFWLILLIPAFYFFGRGFADVLHAKQIRRRLKLNGLNDASTVAELPPHSGSFIETIKRQTSRKLVAAPSVTERTTRDLT